MKRLNYRTALMAATFTGGRVSNQVKAIVLALTAVVALAFTADARKLETIASLPPVAQCRNVTVGTSEACWTYASIDNGSYDIYDLDAEVTLVQDPPGPYPLGVTLVTLTVIDLRGASSQCAAYVTVIDTTPPVITLKDAQIVLTHLDNQYRTVTVSNLVASAVDACDGDVLNNVVISSVSSDEPEDVAGPRDGNTRNDIVIAAKCKSVQLRAENNNRLNGRVYTVTLKVTDFAGNTTRVDAKVYVPNGKTPAVDDGPGAGYTVIGHCGP